MTITDIFEFYNFFKVHYQGDFSYVSPPALPTGSGTLDAGIWWGESDEHFLLGVSVDGSGVKDLWVMMDPAIAAQMNGKPFVEMIYGANPVNPDDVEAIIINEITTRGVEFDYNVGTFFDRYNYPYLLNPSVLVGPGPTFTMKKFSNGVTMGTVSINVSAVPEPASWLSMLAGIDLLGLWRRARRDGLPRTPRAACVG